MPVRPFSKRELINAATTSPWTTNFRHLLPFPRHWLKRTSVRDPVLKSVRSKDRIKYWNVVPGDQIRLLGDKSNTLHEVLSINRISNRVFVKGVVTSETEEGKAPPSRNYHYSRCQLFLGNYELPQSGAAPKVVPVFAQRLGTSAPIWNSFVRRYDWQRFASKTIPTIPHLRGQKIPIPWPEPEKPTYPKATAYDTVREEVARVTYTPPTLTASLDGPLPRPPSEEEFLSILYNSHRQNTLGDSPPVEGYLAKELSNPHARAKKLARWKSYRFQKKRRLDEIMQRELANLNDRSRREARAEAAFKWRQEMKEKETALRKLRWKHRNPDAMLERKKRRKERKERKQRERLTAMVLKEAPNQVIPKDA